MIEPSPVTALRSSPSPRDDDPTSIAGVVTVGLFARRGADVVLSGSDAGVETVTLRP